MERKMKTEWISVKDRLPEDGVFEVLVSFQEPTASHPLDALTRTPNDMNYKPFLHDGKWLATLKEMPEKPTPHSTGEYDAIDIYDYEGQLGMFLREDCLPIEESDWDEVKRLIFHDEAEPLEDTIYEGTGCDFEIETQFKDDGLWRKTSGWADTDFYRKILRLKRDKEETKEINYVQYEERRTQREIEEIMGELTRTPYMEIENKWIIKRRL